MHFTPKEIEFLKQSDGKLTYAEMGRKLKRSPMSVKHKVLALRKSGKSKKSIHSFPIPVIKSKKTVRVIPIVKKEAMLQAISLDMIDLVASACELMVEARKLWNQITKS